MDKFQRKNRTKKTIGLVRPITRGSIPRIEDYDIVEYGPEEISGTCLREGGVSTLIIGGDHGPLQSTLPHLRSSMPNLAVVSISSKSLDLQSINFFRNHVDAVYNLPEDNERLLAAIASEEARHISPSIFSAWTPIQNFVLAASVLLFLWWSGVALFKPAPYLLPSPIDVGLALISNFDLFVVHVATTAYESMFGFILGNSLGVLIAILLYRYLSLQKFTLPVLISFQAIPIVALAPLLVVWMGTGFLSKIAMAAIICFFPMVINTLQAFSNIDRDFAELFEFYRASFPAKLRMLLIPASFPSIVAALKISAGLAVVGAIVAELTGADKGLGYVLLNATYRLETDLLFAAMFLSGLLGIAFFNMPTLLQFIVPRSWRSSLKWLAS